MSNVIDNNLPNEPTILLDHFTFGQYLANMGQFLKGLDPDNTLHVNSYKNSNGEQVFLVSTVNGPKTAVFCHDFNIKILVCGSGKQFETKGVSIAAQFINSSLFS